MFYIIVKIYALFVFCFFLLIVIFEIFVGLDQFIGRGCVLPTIIMFLEYGLSTASLTYCLTFFFSDHTMAQVDTFTFQCRF
jgi:ATP-binding cassette subfamily A (ABC1) protein 3